MRLSGLFLYPVKSLAGISVLSAELDALGLVGDRRFLVVDGAGRFLTQRTLPRMALVATALDATHLTLSTSASASIRVALLPFASRRCRPCCFSCAIGLADSSRVGVSNHSTRPSTRRTRTKPNNCVAAAPQFQPLHRPQIQTRLLHELLLR